MKLFTGGEFARLIDVPTVQLRKWEYKGKLIPFRKSENGGRNYYSEGQLLKALELRMEWKANKEKLSKQ